MNQQPNATFLEQRLTKPRGKPTYKRRGVSSVLAMMFMVIFGSLAAAMAVVAQGNLRTADSALQVSRAMSAAETGLTFAIARLSSEAKRFVIEKGVVDGDFAADLWSGTVNQAADGDLTIMPSDGYDDSASTPTNVVEAIRNAHLADSHSFDKVIGDAALPNIDFVFGILRVKPIALSTDANGDPDPQAAYFRLKYELLADEPFVRVTCQGFSGKISRTLQMDFRIDKRIEFAILSPNRIMIGKNVRVEGPLGSRYGIDPLTGLPNPSELNPTNGHPLVMKSDFYYLDAALDLIIDKLYDQVMLFDEDNDGRLRPDHPTESLGLADPDLFDYNGDEYVDDFDLFMAHYDINPPDGQIVIADEFLDIDNQLARLIDLAYPDRDGDGLPGMPSDIALGYNDGVIDGDDLYAKVHGRLAFAVSQAAWDAAHPPSFHAVVQGPVRSEIDEAPVEFEVSDEDLREITTDMFSDTQTWFDVTAQANFPVQVADGIAAGGEHVGPGVLEYDDGSTWEEVPFGAATAGGAAYDFYRREIYRNMTFENVRIPIGSNALFENCTFVGVTYIETEPDCVHENWNYAGALQRIEDPPASGTYVYELKFPGLEAELAGAPVPDTRIISNNVRFHGCTFLGSISGIKPDEYTHWRNKVQITGETRFYIDEDDPDLLQEIADGNPDAPGWLAAIQGIGAADIAELEKSSLLLAGWSVDVGNFTNDQNADPTLTPKVKLKGTIVAGILDVRGTADIFGTLLMTYRPVELEGPLFYGGLPDAFNTTIGYFGPSDGDGEGVDPDDATFNGFGEITLRYDPDAILPDGIPWPIQIDSQPLTYFEGGSM